MDGEAMKCGRVSLVGSSVPLVHSASKLCVLVSALGPGV